MLIGTDVDRRREHPPTWMEQWRRVLVQSARDLWAGSVLEWSASLAFYAVLSLFPLLIALLILASYLVDGRWATESAIALLGQYLPSGETEIREIVEASLAERRRVGAVSLILLFFTSRRVLGVLAKSLNHVSDVDEHRDPLSRRVAIEAVLMSGVIGLGFIGLAGQPLINWVSELLTHLPGYDGSLAHAIRGLFRLLLLLVTFLLVYYFVPRGERFWRASLCGAVTATVLFWMAEAVYTRLVDRIWETLGLVYGPLALAALLMTWAWYVALVTLIGGGVASHIKVMVIESHDDQQSREQHRQG